MQENLIIALIGAVALLAGSLIGILGQYVGNWLNHKKNLDYLIFETFFKRRQEYLERLGIGIEKIIERNAQIIYFLNNINNIIGIKKLTKSLVKKNLSKIIIEINKEKMADLKPLGSSIYFSDKSPIVSKLTILALEYSNTLLTLRKTIEDNFSNETLIREVIQRANQDIVRAKLLLDEVRKELLVKKEKF